METTKTETLTAAEMLERYGDLSRDETIRRIRAALKRRSGTDWSVKGGTGTARCWIDITAPPRRLDDCGYMTDADRAELGLLLGLDGPAHHQGESVGASRDYYREYIDRAEGREPLKVARPYWD